MAISHVQGLHNANAGSGTSIAQTGSVVGNGNAVLVFVSWDNGSSPTVTVDDDKGNTYTSLDGNISDGVNNEGGQTFVRGNITNGPSTITAHFSVGSGSRVIIWDEYSGVQAATNPTDGHTTNFQNPAPATTDGIVSTNITTTQGNDLIWGATSLNTASGTITQGTGFTPRVTDTTTGCAFCMTEDEIQSSAGAVQTTFTTNTSQQTYCFVVALKAAAAAAATPMLVTLMGVT